MKNSLMPLMLGAMVLLFSITLAAGIGVVYNKHESRRLSIALENLQVEENELELEWQQLQLEQSTLTADAAVDQIARNRLQMIVPRLDEIKYISVAIPSVFRLDETPSMKFRLDATPLMETPLLKIPKPPGPGQQ